MKGLRGRSVRAVALVPCAAKLFEDLLLGTRQTVSWGSSDINHHCGNECIGILIIIIVGRQVRKGRAGCRQVGNPVPNELMEH